MNHSKQILALMAAISLSSMSYAVEHRLPGNLSCNASINKAVVTDMEQVDTGHLVIDASFNNLRSRTVVDTGGIGVGGVINSKSLEQLEYKPEASTNAMVQGAHAVREMKRIKIDSTAVGDASVEGLDFVVSDRSVLPGEEVRALIGSRFLCNYVVDFDLSAGKFRLYPKGTDLLKLQSDNMHWSKSEFINVQGSGAITLDVEIEGKPMKALLDTGARYSLMNWAAAELLGISKDSERVWTEENTARGLHGGGDKLAYKTNTSSVSLKSSGAARSDMAMRIADMPPLKMLIGDEPAVNLGVDFLKNRRLIIDYENSQLMVGELL